MLRRILRDPWTVAGALIVAAFLLIGIFGPYLTPQDPYRQDIFNRFQAPGGNHLLGTDELGRDVASRLVQGARVSLIISLASVAFSLVVGTVLGLIAGFYGGLADTFVSRAIDVLLAFPGMLSAILITAILGPGLTSVILAAGIFSTPALARVVRASTLSLRSREFVESAHASGSGNLRVIFRHILPNCLAPIIVVATTNVGVVLIIASSLSFLGVGIQPPHPEWGAMVASARDYLRTAPHVIMFPGLAVLVVVLGFSLLGDGLRDLLDPKQSDKARYS